MHLVEALLRLHEELAVELDATLVTHVELGDPTLQAVGIELVVPGLVQSIRDVDALAVAAYLHHLGAAVERPGIRMRGAPDDPAEAHRPGLYGAERVGDVVLPEFAGTPARHIEEAVAHG